MLRKLSIGLVVLFAVFAAFLFGYYNLAAPAFLIINLAIFLAFCYFNIYIHELGHVMAGRLVNIETSRVIIGIGKEIMRVRIFSVPLIITNDYRIGLTIPGNIAGGHINLRYCFFMSGGFLLQGVLTTISIAMIGYNGWDYLCTDGVYILHVFVISNIFMIFVNLIPVYHTLEGNRFASDGIGLFKALFLKEKDVDRLQFLGCLFNAQDLFANKEYALAVEAYDHCLKGYPSHVPVRINLSIALLKLKRLDKAKNILLELLGEDVDKNLKGLIYNNMGWIKLLHNTEESLREASNFSKIAFDLNPHLPAIRSTRGSVLVVLGEYSEGISLLLRNVDLNKLIDSETNNPCDLICLAYGYFMTGDNERGRKYFKVVENYHGKIDEDERCLYEIVRNKISNSSSPEVSLCTAGR